jgi:hypothetical protein
MRIPTDFKCIAKTEKRATQGLPDDSHLYVKEYTSKISLTSSVNTSMQVYMEERGLDTVFMVYNPDSNTEVYILNIGER